MTDFKDAARSGQATNVLAELWHFLGTSKKWWLLPILLMLMVFGGLVFLSGTAAAPFIYTLF